MTDRGEPQGQERAAAEPERTDGFSFRRAGPGWWTVVGLVAALAALLRFRGVVFHLPYTYRVDESYFVVRAFRMLSEGSFHPHWFGHPASSTLYLLMGTYGLLFLALLGLGRVDSFSDLQALFSSDPTMFYLAARLWSALFGVACVVVLAEVGRRYFGRATGIVAALALATQLLTVAYSKTARIDTLLPLLVLLGAGCALQSLESGRARHFALVGAIAGLAFMTKYPGAVIALLVPLALLMRGELLSRRGARILAGSAAAFVGVAVVTSPYFFLDPAQVAADLRVEFRPGHPGATGEGLIPNALWYLGRLADPEDGFGPLGAVLAAVGVAGSLIRRRRPGRKRTILMASFVGLALVTNAAATLRWDRWLIPILPLVALLLALGLEELRRSAAGKLPRLATALAALVLAATLAQPLRASLQQGAAQSLPRTQTLMTEWILAHVPEGSAILIERAGVQLPAGRYELYEVDPGSGRVERIDPATRPHRRIDGQTDYAALDDLGELDRNGIDYVVTSKWVQMPYRLDSARYPDAVRRYDDLLAAGDLVWKIDRVPGERAGPPMELYAWRGEDTTTEPRAPFRTP